ncbi:MAG: hypothetical protein LBT56_05030 [Prevotellaceae bacterium]|nr:hypothetical protein [Prevotellaceae bacterium]
MNLRYYIVGALIIEYALKNGGEQSVLKLLEHTDNNIYDLFLNEFGINRNEIHDFMLKLISD